MLDDELRNELSLLGERRRAHERDTAAITAQIRDTLSRAQGHVAMTEAAERLGLDRSTVYRVYLRAA